MRFKQVSGLLAAIADARLAISSNYLRLAGQVDSTRTRMVLEYLAGRERQGHDSLQAFIEQAPEGLLNTWFQNANDSDVIYRVNHVDLDAGSTPQDVLALALSLDNGLIEVLAQQAAQAPTPESRDALLSVMDEEQANQRKMVVNIARFEDV